MANAVSTTKPFQTAKHAARQGCSQKKVFTTKVTARRSRNQKVETDFTTKVTKSTKERSFKISMSETFVSFVCSFENTRLGMRTKRPAWVPSYPRKRVSRLIQEGTLWKESPPFSFSAGERKIMAHFVVETLFTIFPIGNSD
ncbi:MAG: hypothetical protein HYU31_06970 [Deltaproteobacteria bacterium]|nr:hypothetical protein [Deltaproteobacteria bacterium]